MSTFAIARLQGEKLKYNHNYYYSAICTTYFLLSFVIGLSSAGCDNSKGSKRTLPDDPSILRELASKSITVPNEVRFVQGSVFSYGPEWILFAKGSVPIDQIDVVKKHFNQLKGAKPFRRADKYDYTPISMGKGEGDPRKCPEWWSVTEPFEEWEFRQGQESFDLTIFINSKDGTFLLYVVD
jgi:hypothetical protein